MVNILMLHGALHYFLTPVALMEAHNDPLAETPRLELGHRLIRAVDGLANRSDTVTARLLMLQ